MVSVATIKGINIFRELADYELENVAKTAYEETYESGQRIFAEGAWAQRMYVLVEGEIDIRIRPNRDAEQLTVDTVKEGEIFGWSSLTEPYSLTAAALAVKKSKVIVFRGDGLRDLFEKNNHIGFLVMKGIASVISSRLRKTRTRILELMQSHV